MITLAQAKSLTPGDFVHHVSEKNVDGTPQRWKVIGKPKTWKRSLERVQVSVKRGLYTHYKFDETELNQLGMGQGS